MGRVSAMVVWFCLHKVSVFFTSIDQCDCTYIIHIHPVMRFACVGDAYQKLGEMANLRGDFKEAARCFRQAQFTAETLGDDVLAAEARASYGVAKGNDNMEDMMAKVSNDFR